MALLHTAAQSLLRRFAALLRLLLNCGLVDNIHDNIVRPILRLLPSKRRRLRLPNELLHELLQCTLFAQCGHLSRAQHGSAVLAILAAQAVGAEDCGFGCVLFVSVRWLCCVCAVRWCLALVGTTDVTLGFCLHCLRTPNCFQDPLQKHMADMVAEFREGIHFGVLSPSLLFSLFRHISCVVDGQVSMSGDEVRGNQITGLCTRKCAWSCIVVARNAISIWEMVLNSTGAPKTFKPLFCMCINQDTLTTVSYDALSDQLKFTPGMGRRGASWTESDAAGQRKWNVVTFRAHWTPKFRLLLDALCKLRSQHFHVNLSTQQEALALPMHSSEHTADCATQTERAIGGAQQRRNTVDTSCLPVPCRNQPHHCNCFDWVQLSAERFLYEQMCTTLAKHGRLRIGNTDIDLDAWHRFCLALIRWLTANGQTKQCLFELTAFICERKLNILLYEMKMDFSSATSSSQFLVHFSHWNNGIRPLSGFRLENAAGDVLELRKSAKPKSSSKYTLRRFVKADKWGHIQDWAAASEWGQQEQPAAAIPAPIAAPAQPAQQQHEPKQEEWGSGGTSGW